MTALELIAGAQLARALILVSIDGGPAGERDARVLFDQRVVLHAAIEVKRGRSCAWITDAPVIEGRCKKIEAPDARVRWMKVEADRPYYDNVPGGEFRLASIGWIESPWMFGPWTVVADVSPIVRRGIPYPAGTMRYRAIITLQDGRMFGTPSLSEGPGGPSEDGDIRKVMVRMGDDYLGVMTELANLPYIFGSTELGREPHQAERAIGVDCADLMIYGLRLMDHDLGYRSSRTLAPVSKLIAKSGGAHIAVGPSGVRPGDWIIFPGHVGAFYEDRGVIGRLDPQDLLMHISWKELAIEPITDSGYGDMPFEVRRPLALTSK
jgi:hypothetical protein